MVLVDTSVLIDYFRGRETDAANKFQHLLDRNIPYGINSLIYLEILQGVRTEKDFVEVKDYLDTQRFFDLLDKKKSYAAAALIYCKCRKKGIMINSTVDCLIAQTALENNLFLLHHDADFDKMRKVVDLKFFLD